MNTLFLGTFVALGLGDGFLSRLLGLGGAIVMIPLLLCVTPFLGVGQFDMKQVAAISIVQVLSASLTGVLVHSKNRFGSKSLLITMSAFNAIESRRRVLFTAHEKLSFSPFLPLWRWSLRWLCSSPSGNRGRISHPMNSIITNLWQWP